MNVDLEWKRVSTAFSWLLDYLDLTWYDLNWLEYLRIPWLCDNFKQLNWFVTFSIFKSCNHVLLWILKKLVIEIMFWFYFQFCFNSYCFFCKLLFLKITWGCFCGLTIFMIQFWELSGVFCPVYIFRWMFYCLNFMILFCELVI